MEYILMAVSILFSTANSTLLRRFKSRTFKTPGDVFLFNGGVSFIWMFILLICYFSSNETKISFETVVYGAVYGLILSMFLYFKTEALACGPVSLTTLAGSAAFVIPTWFGVVYASEPISVFQLVGVCLILVSLFMCIDPKVSGETLSLKWIIYSISFFFTGGFVGILYKVFGGSDVSDQVNAMMLIASIVSASVFFLIGFFVNHVAKKGAPRIHKDAVPYILLSGITGCVYIRMNLSLANMIPSAVFFPVSNGAMVLLAALAGTVFFGEKCNRMQTIGIALGLLAIIITGCGNYLWQLL